MVGEVEHIGTRVRDSGFRKTRSRKRAGWEGWQFGGLSGVVCQFTGWPRERAAAQDQPSIRATSGERDWSCSIRYRWKTVGFCRSVNGTRSPYVFFTSSRFSYHGSFFHHSFLYLSVNVLQSTTWKVTIYRPPSLTGPSFRSSLRSSYRTDRIPIAALWILFPLDPIEPFSSCATLWLCAVFVTVNPSQQEEHHATSFSCGHRIAN